MTDSGSIRGWGKVLVFTIRVCGCLQVAEGVMGGDKPDAVLSDSEVALFPGLIDDRLLPHVGKILEYVQKFGERLGCANSCCYLRNFIWTWGEKCHFTVGYRDRCGSVVGPSSDYPRSPCYRNSRTLVVATSTLGSRRSRRARPLRRNV